MMFEDTVRLSEGISVSVVEVEKAMREHDCHDIPAIALKSGKVSFMNNRLR